jgi:hypothetical protein
LNRFVYDKPQVVFRFDSFPIVNDIWPCGFLA